MNTIKSLVILSIILFASKVSAQQISSVDLQVTGLTCSMCSQATDESLRTLDFIETIEPDLNKNIFVLTFKKDKAVDFDQIKTKVEDAGFSVGNLDAVFNFSNTKVDDKGLAIAGTNVYQFLNAKDKTLNGPVKATVVDKDFMSGSAFKKKATQVSLESYKTGSGMVNGKMTRIYHLST
ncbi:heavy-metal-associated domain-containing protein [Pedobacter nyackensis]|uniref:Copper chaperone CopZ n=1 Tax=Pedobacter nyackensis TaxID=475255 RepID=A0A1W2F532_9SPHI|nr:heavy-metal-associated domain-containing protein [Pedobacter nyackensis]SMD16658.1 Copper chaperone CopZ [Pedobacter nyackensis]